MFTRIKNNLVSCISPTGKYLSELRNNFRSRLGAFRRYRSAEEQQGLVEDFSRVLAAWGVSDADVTGVITVLRLRLLIFAAPLCVCLIAAALRNSPTTLLILALVAPPCLLGLLTTLWRISILKTRHFLPLCRWLLRFRKRP